MTLICLASLPPCLSIAMKADPKFARSTVTSTTDTVTILWLSVDWGTTEDSTVFKASGEEEL